MAKQFVGRTAELKQFKDYFDSKQSEFIAVYGRRRVGKTFLVRTAAEDRFAFYMTGLDNVGKKEQLLNFSLSLQKYIQSGTVSVPKNWLVAFHDLATYLEALPKGRKIIFIDEMPWMDTPKSGFIPALENFWNSWASLRDDIKLVVCGSATSWMISHLLRNRGGLHNRITHHIQLEPFTLQECEAYFKACKFAYTRQQIAECYMIMGGIPYYMSMMERGKSLAYNIDRLFFASNAALKNEFEDLYKALFKQAAPHIAVVTALSAKGIGMTRQELVKATGLTNNGAFSTVLAELAQCGFIRLYEPFSTKNRSTEKRGKRATVYQLIDFYTLFYFHFIKNNRYKDERFWTASLNSPAHHAWAGLAFEMLCLSHVPQIKQALGISGVLTAACSWRSTAKTSVPPKRSGQKSAGGAQVDLVIDRKDDTINLCEIKYTSGKFGMTADYAAKLRQKVRAFAEESKTRKALILTMITTEGVKENAHSDMVQSEVLLEQLFG